MSWIPTEQDIDEKLIEMAYIWGDIEERLSAAGTEWAEVQRKIDAQEVRFTEEDVLWLRELRDSASLADNVAKAFRVEAVYDENGFGDPCVFYVLYYDVTDSGARSVTGEVERDQELRGLIRDLARPWHTDDLLRVKAVLRSAPVEGQICRRVGQEHPGVATPSLEDVPTFSPVAGSVELVERWPYQLTPIEAPIYDALAETGLTFAVQPWVQHADTKYRVDFLVFYDGGAIAVELDGHDFHKTKEQRGKDAEKQNWLAARKITTIRFTGTQVFGDAAGCASQIVDIARGTPARP